MEAGINEETVKAMLRGPDVSARSVGHGLCLAGLAGRLKEE